MQIALRHISRLSLPFVSLSRWMRTGRAHSRNPDVCEALPPMQVLPISVPQRGPGKLPGSDRPSAPMAQKALRFEPTHGLHISVPAHASGPTARTARTVRVLRRREGPADRLAIVGRMADVCAELDRLVARERLC